MATLTEEAPHSLTFDTRMAQKHVMASQLLRLADLRDSNDLSIRRKQPINMSCGDSRKIPRCKATTEARVNISFHRNQPLTGKIKQLLARLNHLESLGTGNSFWHKVQATNLFCN